MRKLSFFVLAVLMTACTNDDNLGKDLTDQQNCDCDRVVELHTVNISGTPENPAINYYTIYTTINDCSGIQREKTFTTTNPNLSPSLGQCR